MSLRIFNNISSINAQRSFGINNDMLSESLARVASGLRITKSADDATSLSISTSLNSDARTLKQGAKNLNDGLSMAKVAEGGLNEIGSILIRMRELATQSATGTIGQNQRDTVQLEYTSLMNEMDRISSTSEFNGQKLLDGSLSSTAPRDVVLQIGLNSNSDNRINLNQDINLTNSGSTGLGINTTSISTVSQAVASIQTLSTATSNLNTIRARLGAVENRFVIALNNLNSSVVNLTAAESGLKDADMAEEFTMLTRNQILTQSSQAMVGQSNLLPQGVLQLIR